MKIQHRLCRKRPKCCTVDQNRIAKITITTTISF